MADRLGIGITVVVLSGALIVTAKLSGFLGF